MAHLHRFLGVPNASPDKGVQVKAGLVHKDGLVELTDHEAANIAGRFGLSPVDESELTDTEQEGIVRLPVEEPAEETAAAASDASDETAGVGEDHNDDPFGHLGGDS
jgi:hypothetical protein